MWLNQTYLSEKESVSLLLNILLFIYHIILVNYTFNWSFKSFDGMYLSDPHILTEIVISGGMSMPQILSTLDSHTIQGDRTRFNRSWGTSNKVLLRWAIRWGPQLSFFSDFNAEIEFCSWPADSVDGVIYDSVH